MSITALIFAATFAATLVLSLVRHPMYGLYAYLLAFYGFPPARWWGSDLPDLRWALIAAGVTLIGTFRLEQRPGRQPWYANPPAVLLIMFTLWLWLQLVWALDPPTHEFFAVTYTKYIILVFLMYKVLEDEKLLFNFSLAHIVGCVYYAWLAYNVTGGGRIQDIGGPNMNGASAFSAHLSTALILAGIFLFRTKGYLRICIFIAIPIILNGIILTQSRGAFLGLLAGGLAVLFLSPPVKRLRLYSAAALGAVLFLMLAHDVFWERMETIVNAVEKEEMDGSAEGRWVLIDAQWEMFRMAPIKGHGHRGTAMLASSFLDEKWLVSSGGRSSHNTFMSLIVEQGVLGSLIYAALTVWVLLQLLRLKAMDRQGLPVNLAWYRAALGGGFANLFVAGQFADFLRLEITIWCIVMLVIVSRLSREALQADESAVMPKPVAAEPEDVVRDPAGTFRRSH